MKAEWQLIAIIFLLLFLKIGRGMRNETLLSLVQMLLLLNLAAGCCWNIEGSLFDGMYHSDASLALQKTILNLGVYLISLLFGEWYRRTEHLPEFFILLLSSQLGLFFLLSSGHLLSFFLALELSTIPIAAMANFDLFHRRSSEGAMKMILSSAFSSGILLFGISLLYGATGTLRFNEIALLLSGSNLELLAFILIFTGFAFKLSIVPFHLWTADVYEGSPVAVTAFLSVISKGAIAFAFVSALYHAFGPMQVTWYRLLVTVAIATMIIGNLFALRQSNLKRLLAFSSIAQVGFILVGISAYGTNGAAAVVFFILVYIFSNLAAFGVINLIAAHTGKEALSDYKGLYKTNPLLAWVMAIALFSLAGIPPTAGFFGKLFLLTAGASKGTYMFIIIAALNMIISLYYYLIVVKAMFMDANDQPIEKIKPLPATSLGLVLCTAAVILTGLLSWIYQYIWETIGRPMMIMGG